MVLPIFMSLIRPLAYPVRKRRRRRMRMRMRMIGSSHFYMCIHRNVFKCTNVI
jgi:hypothetical protein